MSATPHDPLDKLLKIAAGLRACADLKARFTGRDGDGPEWFGADFVEMALRRQLRDLPQWFGRA